MAELSWAWASQDVGEPALAGSSSEVSGTFTLNGAGTDIWGSADQFHFVYQALAGDGEIVARVDAIANTNSWAKAGVTMREDLTAGAKHASVFITPAHGVLFQRRTATNGVTARTPGSAVAAPYWVRLRRQANTFVAYESPDSTTWRQVGSQSITMATTIHVGLAVTSRNAKALTTATISSVIFTPGAANQPPAIQITAPASGANFTSPAGITIAANASDPDSGVIGVEFFADGAAIGDAAAAPYSVQWTGVLAGTYALTAIATDASGARTTSSPVNITVTDPPTTLPAPWASQDIGSPALGGSAGATASGFTIVAAGTDIWDSADQFHFMYQTLTGDGEIVARVDSLVNTSVSAKAGVMIRESLTAGPRHAYSLASAASGMAFQRRLSTGGTSVNTGGTLASAPRWVRLTRRGDTFQAYESADGIAWTLNGSDTLFMASTVYAGLAVTSHNAIVRTTAVFSNVRVVEVSPSNQPPAVALTSPASGFAFAAPAAMNLAASASDADGTIARVDFYVGNTLLASDGASPYTAAWNVLSPGTYTIRAVAVDSAGAQTTSAAVTVTANPTPLVFTASADHDTLVTSYRLEVFAAGADPNTASPRGTQDLGKPTPASGDITVDITATLLPLAPGSYIATVSAIGSAGASRSLAVPFTR